MNKDVELAIKNAIMKCSSDYKLSDVKSILKKALSELESLDKKLAKPKSQETNYDRWMRLISQGATKASYTNWKMQQKHPKLFKQTFEEEDDIN